VGDVRLARVTTSESCDARALCAYSAPPCAKKIFQIPSRKKRKKEKSSLLLFSPLPVPSPCSPVMLALRVPIRHMAVKAATGGVRPEVAAAAAAAGGSADAAAAQRAAVSADYAKVVNQTGGCCGRVGTPLSRLFLPKTSPPPPSSFSFHLRLPSPAPRIPPAPLPPPLLLTSSSSSWMTASTYGPRKQSDTESANPTRRHQQPEPQRHRVHRGRSGQGRAALTPGCQIGYTEHTGCHLVNWCLRAYALLGLPPLPGVTRLVTWTIPAVINCTVF
jgi:hypothetical protein